MSLYQVQGRVCSGSGWLIRAEWTRLSTPSHGPPGHVSVPGTGSWPFGACRGVFGQRGHAELAELLVQLGFVRAVACQDDLVVVAAGLGHVLGDLLQPLRHDLRRE